MTFTFHPVTPERWPDMQRVFRTSTESGSGNPSRCWCMEWRLPRAEWEAGEGEGNRLAMQRFIEAGNVPGLLAYDGDEPVGWCSIAPRMTLPSLRARGAFRNFEDPAVWTVACFYVRDDHQGRGLTGELLGAAVEHARAHGARRVEGYPVDPDAMPDWANSRFLGFVSAFRKAGFVEVARAADGRPTMRYRIEEAP